jgi:hypothetical protein
VLLDRVRVKFPSCHEKDEQVKAWTKVGEELAQRAEQVRSIAEYSRLLMLLTQGDRLEDFMAALDVNQKEKAIVSKRVWDGWLRVMPDRLTAEARVELGNFASVLKTIIQAQASNVKVPGSTWAGYYQLLPKVSSYLPCWAVTALAVHKRFPFAPGSFDLLIIDEASQCDISAILPLLYRAKAVVIIGDPKQLSFISAVPAAVDADLLHTHGLSENPIWGYSVNSVYDLAVTLADSANVVQLLDHHRSHADIIGFSVQEFYSGKLRIATDYRKLMMIDPNTRAIQWIDLIGQVTRSERDGIVNEAEAQKVVKVLERLALVRNYQGSMGVVTPFRGQANRIRQIIRQKPVLDAALNRRNFMVEAAHSFQGDERDIMIFSPVVSTDTPQGALYFLSPKDMTEAVKSIDAVRAATGAHVTIIHHCGKDEAKGARGHSSLRAAIDTEIEVFRPDGETVSTVKITKQRDLPVGEAMPFSLESVTLGIDRRGKPITSCVVRHEDSIMAATHARAGRKAETTPAKLLDLLPMATTSEWQKVAKSELGVSQTVFYKVLEKIKREKLAIRGTTSGWERQ